MSTDNFSSSILTMVTFAFGLVHGFGFSFALRQTLQFAGSHLVTALLAFNVGVEFGQIAVLLVLVPALNLLFRYLPERIGVIILFGSAATMIWLARSTAACAL